MKGLGARRSSVFFVCKTKFPSFRKIHVLV